VQALAYVLYLLYLALVVFQIAAAMAGVQYWLELHWLLAAVIAVFVAPWPVLGTVLGMVGAHHAWGWSWLAAFFLFLGPLLAIGGLAIIGESRSDRAR
jgi:hypothetical protein